MADPDGYLQFTVYITSAGPFAPPVSNELEFEEGLCEEDEDDDEGDDEGEEDDDEPPIRDNTNNTADTMITTMARISPIKKNDMRIAS